MNEEEIISRCVKKDLTAWDEFVERYSRLITAAAQNRLKRYGFSLPTHEIEDIKQNTFSSLWEGNKLAAVENQKDISYWLAIVSGNEAVDYIRKHYKEGLIKSKSLFEKIDDAELIEIIPSGGALPSEELKKNELSKKISAAIRALPSREKLVIKLNLLDGKKYYEIAEMLRLPRGTVSNYIRRVKEKLKKALINFLIFFATISALFTSLYVGASNHLPLK